MLSCSLLLLLSLSLFPLLSLSYSTPTGTWTYVTNEGYGPLYLCLGSNSNSILTGVYSEYGYVRGVYTAGTRKVTGKWFEVGVVYTNGLPTSGTFTWTFNADYTSFTGSFYYDGQNASQAHAWSETRLDAVNPTNMQCFRHTTTSSSFNGQWAWPSTALMFSQNGVGTNVSLFNASVVNEESPGYSEGVCDTTYQVCRGQILRTDYYGQIMYVLGSSSVLYVTSFEGSWEDYSLDIPSQLSSHLYVNASLSSSLITEADAAVNQLILFQGSFTDTPVQSSFSYFQFVTGVGTGVNVEGYYFESSVVRGNYNWTTRTLSGLWFDPGLLYPMDTYTTGTFTFQMGSDWGMFSGFYYNIHVGETEPYSGDQWGPFYRASFTLPPLSAVLYDTSQPDTPITGYYVGKWTLYLCASDNMFNASFVILDSGVTGYATGRCGPTYKVCNGDFISNSQRGELLITVLTDATLQIDFYYTTSLQIPDPSLRNSIVLTGGTHDISSSQCGANLYLPFVGNFSDPEYGHFFYISYDPIGHLLNGFYSEVGVVRGGINAESGYWEARWVEPGVLYSNTSVPPAGYVFFKLVSLDSFTGTFFFDNSLQYSNDWGLVTRYSYNTPSNALAWVDTAYSLNLDGIYFTANDDQIWFCEYVGNSNPNLNHPYYMSFAWNESGVFHYGYSEGGCSYQTRVCHGDWFDNYGNSGVLVTSLADQNNLRISTFTGEMMSNISSQVGKPSLHQLKSYTRKKMTATDAQCHQYDSAHSLFAGISYLVALVFMSLFW